jgi:hypothetical protein
MILHYCIDKQEKMPNLDVRKLTHSEAPIHSPKIVFAPPTTQTEAEHHQTTEFNNESSIPKENKHKPFAGFPDQGSSASGRSSLQAKSRTCHSLNVNIP